MNLREEGPLDTTLQHSALSLPFCSHPTTAGACSSPKLGIIASPVEDVVDLPTNIRPEPQKLAIDAMQNGLEKVPLSRVLTVK